MVLLFCPDSAPEGGAEGGVDPSAGFKDTSLMMDLLMEDLIEDDYPDSFSIMDIPPHSLDSKMYPFSAFGKAPKKKSTGSSTQQNGELDFMLSSPLSQAKRYCALVSWTCPKSFYFQCSLFICQDECGLWLQWLLMFLK